MEEGRNPGKNEKLSYQLFHTEEGRKIHVVRSVLQKSTIWVPKPWSKVAIIMKSSKLIIHIMSWNYYLRPIF